MLCLGFSEHYGGKASPNPDPYQPEPREGHAFGPQHGQLRKASVNPRGYFPDVNPALQRFPVCLLKVGAHFRDDTFANG